MSKTESKKPSFVLRLVFFLNVLIGLGLIGAYLNTFISPNSISYLSFLGLGYPYLIYSIAGFSLLWLVFHRRYLIFNVVIFLLGWNHFTDFYAFNNSSRIHSAGAIKVMS